MTRLLWNKRGERFFETGVDRGVFYLPLELVDEEQLGYAWNGLISVNESIENKKVDPIYYDGRKVLDLITLGDFSGSITALTYPDEFEKIQGVHEWHEGISFDNQLVYTFGLTYRTLIGNDLKNRRYGYKIHILYNLTAIPEAKTYQSVDSNVEPIVFSWSITSIPETISGFRPTAHVILDSTKVNEDNLLAIENILYGTSETEARLITIAELYALYDE